MSDIPNSYCIYKLRENGKHVGRDAIKAFKSALSDYATKLSKHVSSNCDERGRKTVDESDVALAIVNLGRQ